MGIAPALAPEFDGLVPDGHPDDRVPGGKPDDGGFNLGQVLRRIGHASTSCMAAFFQAGRVDSIYTR